MWVQVRIFSSQEHTSALLAGDVTAAVGWSTELVPLSDRSTNISLVAPASGEGPLLHMINAPKHGTVMGSLSGWCQMLRSRQDLLKVKCSLVHPFCPMPCYLA